MSYKILDLYRDLPRTNCRECGRTSCLSLAGAVFLEGAFIGTCPHLRAEATRRIEQKLQKETTSHRGDPSLPDALSLAALLDELASRDLSKVAKNTGAVLSQSAVRALHLEYFGRPRLIFREGTTLEDEVLATRAAFIVLNHLVRSRGTSPAGEWISYRELPRTAGTLRSFRSCVMRLASAFSGRVDNLVRAAQALDGREGEQGSATVCYVFIALPRVALRLRFWDREEDEEARARVLHPEYGRFTSASDFDARAEVQVDQRVLDELDPEAILCLTAELVDRLLGTHQDPLPVHGE